MVSSEGKAVFDTDMIIDSGADVSVLPLSMSACGSDAPQKQERYVDAQGKPMRITQRRICDVYLPGLNGDVLLREEFVVAPVSQPLLSAGKLMRAGWRIGDRDGQPQLWNGKTTVMASYKLRSFCVTGEIRAVHEDVCHGNYIQVTLLPALSKVKTGWCHLSKSVWAARVLGMQYTDVAACLHETGLDTGVDRRTTIVQIENEWLLVEYDEQLSSFANVSGFVEGLKVPTDIITIAHVGHMSPRELGFEVISSPQYPNNPEESASSSAPGPRPRSNADPALQQPQLDAAPSDAPVVPVEPVEQRAVEGALRDDMEVAAADPGEHQVEEKKGRVLSESDTLATL